MRFKFSISILMVFIWIGVQAQSAPQDWFHLDSKRDNYNGVSSNKAYDDLLKGKKGKTIVVAVIDSGIDVEHEDLKDVMWVNPGEIAGNGKDDDNNGYVDDIHGWNFIGGADGSHVNDETLEVTRLYKSLKYKYENADESQLNKKQKKEYANYLVYKEEVEKNREGASKNLARMEQNKEMVMGAIDGIAKAMGDKEINAENINAIEADGDQGLTIGKNVMLGMISENGSVESYDDVRKEISDQIQGGVDYYTGQLDFNYNPDFDPRPIIGDNYADSYERDYGNNDVEGPDAMHGTHVAGIIGATRNNGIGMNGVADNVRIMSVRTVPNGDERDKDVANAIIYAVDNGASVINMRFGKGFSWDKKVVDKAVKYAMKKDVLLVHAAGNSAQDNDATNNFPNDDFEKKGWCKKKKANNWVEVGALNHKQGEDLPAPFSNYGSNAVDVFAPGMQIYATVPGDEYRNLQGTSMASPVVAGVAAVIRSHYPGLTAAQVKEILIESSMPLDQMVKKPGADEKVNFSTLSVGGGVANMHSALEMAKKTKGKKKVKKMKA